MGQINQYEIVLVNLDPTIGTEMKNKRPCVVLSPNEMNRHLQTIVVAPITSHSRPYPTRVECNLEKTKGWMAIDQIRTIDKSRIVKKLENLSNKEVIRVKKVIEETYVL